MNRHIRNPDCIQPSRSETLEQRRMDLRVDYAVKMQEAQDIIDAMGTIQMAMQSYRHDSRQLQHVVIKALIDVREKRRKHEYAEKRWLEQMPKGL